MGGKTSSRELGRAAVTPSKSGFRESASLSNQTGQKVYEAATEEETKAAINKLQEMQQKQQKFPAGNQKIHITSLAKEAKTEIPEDFMDFIPDLEEPQLAQMPKKAGMVVVEPDGRIWMVRPRNEYAGYVQTFPKGGAAGQELVYGAMTETAEEAGIAAVPVAFLGDIMGDFNPSRYYIGVRVGGNPNSPGTPFETEQVVLEDMATAYEKTVRSGGVPNARDRKILLKALEWMKKNGVPTLNHIKKMKKFTGKAKIAEKQTGDKEGEL